MLDLLTFLEGAVPQDIILRCREQITKGADPIEQLFKEQSLGRGQLQILLAKYYGVPWINIGHYIPDSNVLAQIPEYVARRFNFIPLFFIDNEIFVAMSDPDDVFAKDYIRQLTSYEVVPVFAFRADLRTAINKYYLTKEKSEEQILSFYDEQTNIILPLDSEMVIEDEEAPAIKMVNHILSQAVHLGASDVHLEPFPGRASLRYRVDGVMHDFPSPPLVLYRSIISRIKIISNLNVAERRLPQDGRSDFQVEDRKFDLRISIIPNLHGEGVVIRLLDTKGAARDIKQLGFSQSMLVHYEKLIKKPYGIILVTGPTGSGKSSTIYASLRHIYTSTKKMITIEDPVEYQLDGIVQIQVQPDIGYTFTTGLRSVLRHDPDIIMLGEIRDVESAQIAIRTSLTGHLVLSSLHTNDAISAVTRLIDMGLQPFLVLSSLIGVLAQRLIRRLCGACKTLVGIDSHQLKVLNITAIPDQATIYAPNGCGNCGGMGYKGRIAIFELLEITEPIKRIHNDSITNARIVKLAVKQGFTSLRDSAMEKLFAGLTSIEEVVNVTIANEIEDL